MKIDMEHNPLAEPFANYILRVAPEYETEYQCHASGEAMEKAPPLRKWHVEGMELHGEVVQSTDGRLANRSRLAERVCEGDDLAVVVHIAGESYESEKIRRASRLQPPEYKNHEVRLWGDVSFYPNDGLGRAEIHIEGEGGVPHPADHYEPYDDL